MKSGPADENFCTVTNNRKQNLPKNKIFQQKNKMKLLYLKLKLFFFASKFFIVH